MTVFKRKKGFTLIEVLVSLAVLTVALGVIIKGSAEQTKQLSYLKDKTYAYFVAENVLSELKTKTTKLNKGSTKDIKKLNGQNWFVEQIVTETAAKDMLGEGQFLGVRVEVKKNEADETPLTTLQTYINN